MATAIWEFLVSIVNVFLFKNFFVKAIYFGNIAVFIQRS
jgi:hypothetical protein